MKFDVSKHACIAVLGHKIGEELHAFSRNATKEEFVDAIIDAARDEGIEYEHRNDECSTDYNY